MALKFNCSDKTIKKRVESIVIYRKKRKVVPEVSKLQSITQWYRVRRLNNALKTTYQDIDIVMDDESYFHLSNDVHNKYYYPGRGESATAVKCIPKTKFEKKVLVWVAISPRGTSSILILANSKQNVSSEFYIKFMIQDHLLPFLNTLYEDGRYLFRPDNASAHYSESTQHAYDEMGINYVEI